MTALVFICTGEPYWQFLQDILDDVQKFWKADVLLFTDSPKQWPVTRQVFIPQTTWPGPTLMRYHYILNERDWLSRYNHVFFMDVDMRIIEPIGDEILTNGIVAMQHPGYTTRPGTPETDPRSTAYVQDIGLGKYVMGGFQGGATKAYLEMAEILKANIDKDAASNFIAKWHDESHLNRYVQDHDSTSVKVIMQPYCCNRPGAKINWVNKKCDLRPAINGQQLNVSLPKTQPEKVKPLPCYIHPHYPRPKGVK